MIVKDFTSGENETVSFLATQVLGTALNLEMPKNSRGVAQCTVVSLGGLSGVTVKLQGRVSSEVDFIDVDSGTFGTPSAGTTVTLTDIQLYPQMRAVASVGSGQTATFQAYVTIGA